MRSFVKNGLLGILVAGLALVVVTDVHAWPFRRGYRGNYGYSGRYNYGTNYGTYGTYGTAPATVAVPNATVTAPGVGVNAGPGGATVVAPGVGVNAGRGVAGAGANVAVPGAGVNAGGAIRAGANLNAPGVNAQGTIRGQSPDGPGPVP